MKKAERGIQLARTEWMDGLFNAVSKGRQQMKD